MNEYQFYPTPDEVIEKMISPYLKTYPDWEAESSKKKLRARGVNTDHLPESPTRTVFAYGGIVCDPSAGTGAILEYLQHKWGVPKHNLVAIEIHPGRRDQLYGLGYRVLEHDFMDYDGIDRRPNMYVMNPPFLYGCDHLLHAWELLPDNGGDIACLLNAETIKNPYTSERARLREIIGAFGKTEEIGQVFQGVEVDAVIVWLTKPGSVKTRQSPDIVYGDYEKDQPVSEPIHTERSLASPDLLDALVAQYHRAVQLAMEQRRIGAELAASLDSVKVLGVVAPDFGGKPLQNVMDGIRAVFWGYVFAKTKIGELTTSQYAEKFSKFTENYGNIAFTAKNIAALLETVTLNRRDIILECLDNVFDQATRYHHGNKVHQEGWKTNKGWKIQERIVIPRGPKYDGVMWRTWDCRHEQAFCDDLDKTMCYLTGREVKDIERIWQAIEGHMAKLSKEGGRYSDAIRSTFFEIRFYKKGTIHLRFLDLALLEKFNLIAAQNKGWIGGGE